MIPIKTTQISFVDRLLAVLSVPSLESVWLMASNLLRFVVWQHPLLVPLAAFGAWAAWRAEPLVRSLALGFLLPVIVMWILLPWQGGGWGYRYVHPVMGNAVLLGGWGVHRLQQRGFAVEGPLLWTTALAVFVLLPIHGFQANGIAAPLAAKDKAYSALDADLLLVDERIMDDFVHNRPDLSNRPIRLITRGAKPEDLPKLCAGRRLIFLDPALPVAPSETQQRTKAAALAAGCDVRQVREPWST